MRFLLVDLANTFFRSRHAAFRSSSIDEKIGMALHITISSVNSLAKKFDPDHVVFALEGRSWRKDFYEPYKRNRQVARNALTTKEQEEEQLFWEIYEELVNYLTTKTNCSVIRCPTAEGDDVIARWIAMHPNDHHTIISSDSDFAQLLSENVNQYNGIADELITLDGITTIDGKPILDKKTKEPKAAPNPEWLLFEKIIRGDTSDNIFSAYPGVRTNGSKNKVGLREAFDDRQKKGWAWNNLQLQRWTDHNGDEHKVLDDYNRNKILIDLTCQPEDIKLQIDTSIREGITEESVSQVGVKFLKFCGKHSLIKLGDQAESIGRWMSKVYCGEVKNDSDC
jgi:5'-3' exonuclease